jgi:NAD(P)-dependent dehydrogenase (short-subunit alcohol dehydrogenase family)
MPNMAWVAGRTVVVTGGSSGIGKGVAFALAQAGGKVVVAGRTLGRVEVAVAQVEAAGGRAAGLPTDVGDPVAVDRLMEYAVERFGALDGVVTAAGLGKVGPLLAQPREDIEETVRTDLLGTIYSNTSAASRMRAGSQIVTIASSMAGAPSPTMPVYAAVKTGVVILSESVRGELAARGIRLSCLLPGGVATHFQDGWGPSELGALGIAGSGAGVAKEAGGPDLSGVMRARDIAPSVLFAFDLPERSRGATLEVV